MWRVGIVICVCFFKRKTAYEMRISDWSSDVYSSDLGYALFDARYPYLFNSYYEAEGPRHARPQRGLLTRPTLDEICVWRAHVDAAVQSALPDLPPSARALVTLGIHHEQQHQEDRKSTRLNSSH